MKQVTIGELTKSTDQKMKNKNMMKKIDTEFKDMGKLKITNLIVVLLIFENRKPKIHKERESETSG